MARAKNLSAESSENDNKRAKFVQLAEKRLDNAVGKIKLLGNLGNKTQYEYSDEDVKIIATELGAACQAVISRLQGKSATKGASSRFK